MEKYLTKSRIFLLLSLAASMGLGFGFKLSAILVYLVPLVSVMIAILGWGKRTSMSLALIGLVFSVAVWHSQNNRPPDLSRYYGQKMSMTVLIVTDPDTKDRSINALGILQRINDQEINVRVALVLSRYPEYEYGTLLEVEAKLEEPSEFNRKDNVSGQIAFPDVSSAEPEQGNKFKAQLYRLKKTILLAINKIIPDPESGLMGGLLLGTRKVPQEVVDNFRTTGTAHIVAVSGFNVTIVAVFLDQILRRFGRSTSFYASVFGIFAFVIITGASASVVRAGFMGCLGLLATQAGRLYSSSNAIVFASAIMLVQQPSLLLFDIGFQLSFAALAGLLYVQPKFEQIFPNMPGWIKSFAMPTISAQITTTPLSLYHFGNFSLISVVANVLVLPLIPVAMLLGALAVALYFIWPMLGIIAGAAGWLVLKYILWAIALCSAVPLAALKNIPFPMWALILYNIILILWLIWKPKSKN